MPPKFDPSQVVTVTVRTVGGTAGNPAALAPKLGPLGLSPKKIGDDIAKATADWKGLRVTVKLSVQNRQATIEVIPSAAALIIKALNGPPRTIPTDQPPKHNGNITMEDVKTIAKVMRPRSMAKTFAGTVNEILGTAVSIGCTIDGQDPKDVQAQITNGEIEIEN